MRNIIVLVLLIPLINSCTVVGFVADHVSNKKAQRRSDSINKSGQEILLQEVEGPEVSGTFTGFSYGSDTEEMTTYKEDSFPQLGDSITISLENGKNISGTFAGIMHTENQNELILKPTWNQKKVKYYPLFEINSLEDPVSNLSLDQPVKDRVYIHFMSDTNPFTVNLADIRHLNKQVVKKNYTKTFIGVAVDATILLITVNQLNSMNFGWD